MDILLAVDGSKISSRAAKYVVRLARELAKPPRVVLVSVDAPLLQRVAVTIGPEDLKRFHAENTRLMSREARRTLLRAGLHLEEELHVGDVAGTILRIARKRGVDQIVMGSHGDGPLRGLFLGSVSAKVIAGSTLPVTIVR